MNVSVKNVDEATFRKLKAVAAELGKPVGRALTEAADAWIDKNRKILAGIEEIVAKAKEDKDMVAVMLFGSYARNEQNFRDVDVALLLREDGGDYIKKATEYWVSDIFDVSILNRLPLQVASRVLEEGRLLYVADQTELENFSLKIIRTWSDFRPLYNNMVSQV